MTTLIENPRTRNIIPLSDYDRENDNDERIKLAADIRQLSRNRTSVIYPNQQTAAMKIYETFCDVSKVFVIIVALTQSGKTGTILAFIKECISSKFSSPFVEIVFSMYLPFLSPSNLKYSLSLLRKFTPIIPQFRSLVFSRYLLI